MKPFPPRIVAVWLIAAVTGILSASTSRAQETYALEYFGGPAGQSPTTGAVGSLNERGQFIVNYMVSYPGQRSWTCAPGHSFTQLPLPSGYAYSVANDIDNGGVIVGTVTLSAGRGIAAVWDPTPGGYVVRTLEGLPGHPFSAAVASNNLGDIIGFSYATSSSTAVPVWFRPDGSVVALSTVGYPATLSVVDDISDTRLVCGNQYRLDLNTQTLTDLGLPPTPPGGVHYISVTSMAINDSGQVAAIGVLSSSSHPWHIIRYTDGIGWQVISIFALTYGAPFDINNDGSVLMGTSSGSALDLIVYSDAAGLYLPGNHLESEAFYWLPQTYPARLNNAGQIVATVLNVNNSDQRFGLALLTPIGRNIVPGDVNADGHVRLDDLCAWAAGPIDLDGDGVADAADEQFLIDRLAERGLTTQDCNANSTWDYCEIAAGSSPDCDRNGVPDACQADCNGDGVPDACESDCNSNGTSDPCDIASGISHDCNGNGVPDECDGASTTAYPFSYPPLSTPIFPNATLTRSEIVRGAGVIADVNARLQQDYRVGDVAVWLSHAGVTVTLTDRAGYPSIYGVGFTELGYNAILDDEGTGGFIEDIGNYGGHFEPIISPPSYRPNSPLSAFDGLPVSGEWTLEIQTFNSSPIAMLYDWGVTITKTAVPVGLCAGDIDVDGDVDFADQALFVAVLLGTDTNPDHVMRSNLNGDAFADGNDIAPFIIALIGG